MDNVRAAAGRVQENAANRLATSKERTLANLEKANDLAEKGQYKLLGKSLKTFVKDRHNVNMEMLKAAGYGLTEASAAAYDKASKEAKKALFDVSGPMRAKVMFGLRGVIKDAVTADPDMCDCLKIRIDRLVDLIWDDVTKTVEIAFDDAQQATLGKVETDVEVLGNLGEKPKNCLYPSWWRARFLYHFLPFDVSILGQAKDPVFWILTILCCVPYFGIRVAFFAIYLIYLCCPGPPDEFQLVTFLMGLKGSQFLSSGICMGLYAGVKYYICVRPGELHTCEKNGPGVSMPFYSSVIDFFGTCILGWVCFWCFPCSVRSAGLREIVPTNPETGKPIETNDNKTSGAGDEESDEEVPRKRCGCCRPRCEHWEPTRGGRLVKLLRYDLICFIFSCLIFFLLQYLDIAHLRPGGKDPDFGVGFLDLFKRAHTPGGQMNLFWARTIYALLAFPFTIFYIPGLQGILTHTTFTGYNQQGLCVPYKLRPVVKEKQEDAPSKAASSNAK